MNIKSLINKVNRNSEEITNVKYLFVLQIFDKIVPLVVTPYLMVTLGATGYGYVGFSMAVIQYLMLLTDFGFNLSATQRIAIARENGGKEISKVFLSTFVAKVALLIFGTVLGGLLIFLVPSLRVYLKTLIAIYPMVIGTVLTSSWFFQGIGKIRISAVVTSISKLLVLPLTFILVKNAEDYNLAALVHGVAYFLAGCVNFILILKLKLVKMMRLHMKDIMVEIKESFPLFLSSVATSAYTQLYTIILGLYADASAVGRYSASEKIMRSLCFAIYPPISAAYYPKVASLSQNNKASARQLLKRLSKVVFLMMLVLSVCLFVFAVPISTLLGKEYQDFSTLLRIMAFSPIAIAMGAVYGQMGLVAMGNIDTKKQFKRVYVIAGAISTVVVLILTYFFAETGASISLLVTEYLVFVMMYNRFRRNICHCS